MDIIHDATWRKSSRSGSHKYSNCVECANALAPRVTITTFGYGHGQAPAAHITLDLRVHFKDPHVDPALRDLTAHDDAVRMAVLTTPGIQALIDATTAAVLAYLDGPSAGPVTVAIGCAGGRHRAATVGMQLTQALSALWHVPTLLIHRDLGKDVIDR